MNPQYMPQQYGAPPQNFQQNRPSPALTPQGGFQNVPLGAPKPIGVPVSNGPQLGGYTQSFGGQPPPGAFQNQPPASQFGPSPPMSQPSMPPQQPNVRPPHVPPGPNQPPLKPAMNIPQSQLPPQQSQFGGPMPKSQDGMPEAAQQQFQNGPPAAVSSKPPGPYGQPGPVGEASQRPPGGPVVNGSNTNKFSGMSGPQEPPKPGPNQPPVSASSGSLQYPAQPPVPNQSQKPFGQSALPPVQPNQFGSGQHNQFGPGQPNQFGPGQPPFSSQPPMSGQPMPGQPPMTGQPMPGQPPMSGQPMPGLPPMPGQQMPGRPFMSGQPPIPGQTSLPGQSLPGPNSTPGQPPLPGQNSMPGQSPYSGQPPVSGQPPMPPYGQPPLPGQIPNPQSQLGQPPNQFGQSPMANQYMQPGPNQLAHQVQGMNISGGRPYGPPGKQLNEGSPHMPPPLNQQQYINGPQVRSPQMPGYPPMPGQQQMPGQPMPGQQTLSGQPPMPGGPYPPGSYQQPQQQRRLDPDQMPSPIQVTQDDQRTRSGVFCTNQKGLVPPLVSTNFTVQDQGNASPRFIRSTMYNVPVTQDLMKQTAVPFGLVISPMARTVGDEYPPPIVNFGQLGPVRCIRCKAYMCPFMQFIDSGRRFQCLFCKATTDVPMEYFQHLDHTGQRMDRLERPELVLGTYEFTATTDYCRNNTLPKPPAIIFVLDVSYNNIKSGLVHLLCSRMKEVIQNLPIDQGQDKSNMRIGFITYNNTVHFYNIKGSLAAPQMLVVGDVHEMFMPLLDGFLCTPEESEIVIDALMQQIPAMFGDTRETETILLPAILAGLEALKASECTGKLLVFHSSLPIAEAPGKLKNREDRKLLGTDKERTILIPQTQAYNQLGQDCVGAGCCVDLFLFNNAYIDIATIGQVSRLTGGEIFKYTYFQADIDGERLIQDIIIDISRPIAFDAIMRVRTSTGIRATDFYGHFFMSNTTDMELAAIDCDKAVAIEIKHDDKLTEEEGVFVQVALLYTSCSGQRRLRILNLSLKTCSQMADLYRSCELDTIINFFGKQSIYKLLENNPKAVKDAIVARAAQMLANYRKNCASPSSAGQLILPECMKLLPLYVNCLLKSDALSGGSDITQDDRSFVIQTVMIMDIPSSASYFYPRLIAVHDVKPDQDGAVEIPPTIRSTIEKITDQGVYILENGIHMFLYVGLSASPEFVQQVFGVSNAMQIDVDRCFLPELDNPLSVGIRSMIDQIRIERHRCMRLTIVRQREKLEPVFKHFLVEDRGVDGSPSYVDFLCHMHKEIRTILS